MNNLESGFSAQVEKLNSMVETKKQTECITDLMLLSNSSIEENQSVSVMAAGAPYDPSLTGQSTKDQMLSSTTYN